VTYYTAAIMTNSHHPRQSLLFSITRSYRALPRSIWVLGVVSMFMDVSSELIHSVLPIYMSMLGASMMTIGLIEGIAESTTAITKIFSGVISDYFRVRKAIVITGYGLAAITKPVFPLATSMWWVSIARFVDRIGKGIRGAPRDALIADITPAELRGAAYGLRQSLDTVGAFIGPLLAVLLMLLLADDLRKVMWLAALPAFLAVLLLFVGVHEPEGSKAPGAPSLTWRDAHQLPFRYWFVVALGATFTLARFSEAFLILRAQKVGLDMAYVPVIMIVMNIVYAVLAYPLGEAADRTPARRLMMIGLLALIIADVVLALATSPSTTFVGAAFWGLHMAFTQGLLSKLIADTAPATLRGTAFGLFNLVSGIALLLASVIAGALWSKFGASATFYAGAGFAVAAMCLLMYQSKND